MNRVVAVASVLAAVCSARADRLRVCTFAFHGPDEIRAFERALPPDDFDVVDLGPTHDPAATPAPGPPRTASSWLFDLCRPDVRCDVAVYSGEFAGTFFGASGSGVGLADLQEASCLPACDGLFHAPDEVFLLACNTLATKDQDTRAPAQYLQVLLDHGFDQATAERVVAARYGPLGASFRESFRRTFMGVPRLYGFASVAPAGERTAPLLERYFRTKGDYRGWLARARGTPVRNVELLAAFHDTSLVQESGLSPDEAAAADRNAICRLYDERSPVADRLRIVAAMLRRPDFMSFLPTIQMFLDRHPPAEMTGEDAALFADVVNVDAAREELLRVIDELGASTLKLELAHVARHLRWLTPEAFRALAVDAARQLLVRPLTSEAVDVVCEIPKHVPLRDEFTSDDLPPRLFELAEGIRLVDCVATADPRVTQRLVPGLDLPELSGRLWAAHALSSRLPLDDTTLVQVARHLDDPDSPDLHARLEWILRASAPVSAMVHDAVAAHDRGLAATIASR